MKRIAFVSETNPFTDKVAWSGTVYKLREAIEGADCTVEWIPCHVNSYAQKWMSKIFRRIYRGCGLWDKNALYFRLLAHSIDSKRLNEGVFDYIFFPAYYQAAVFLKTDAPVIGHGDATFHGMEGYYWKDLPAAVSRMGNRIEKRGLQACDLVIRASDWAANSAKEDYGIDPSKVKMLQLGANFDMPRDIVWTPYEKGGRLNVIFSGVDWERKGGDIAVQTVRLLRERGIDARLRIMGIRNLPESAGSCDFVENVGFLNKNVPEQYSKYVECYGSGHIFLLPTKAECAGVVFCEASGFGIPSFTYDTGGTGSYVENGVNGYRLELGSQAEAFADRIMKVLESGELEDLHKGALKKYEDSLSWEAWSRRFKQIINNG